MIKYKVIIHDPEDKGILWVNCSGRQVVSRSNSAFWVTEGEKDILLENLKSCVQIVETGEY